MLKKIIIKIINIKLTNPSHLIYHVYIYFNFDECLKTTVKFYVGTVRVDNSVELLTHWK